MFHESRYQAVFDENMDISLSAEWLDEQNVLQERHLRMENKVPQQMQIPPDDIPGQMGQNPIMTLSHAITSPDDVYTPNCQSPSTIMTPGSLVTDESQISDSPQQVSSS